MPTDKMPKHVEMVRTKSKPKNGTDKMPTTKKAQTKCQPLPATKLGLFIWQNPLDSKTQRGFHGKPTVLYRAQSYGKTHWMGKAIGESMVKAMEPRLQI